MREGQVLLETAPGSAPLPGDCFAALRLDDGSGSVASGSLLRCKTSEVTCFKDVPLNGPVAKVDLFKYVGSINLVQREPGTVTEANVQWPGMQDAEVLTLRLTLSVAAAEEALRRPSFSEAYDFTTGLNLRSVPVDASAVQAVPSELRQPSHSDVVVRQPTRTQSPAPPHRTSVDDRGDIMSSYRPIVLNNCNQIIPFLYLGGVDAATDTQALVQQGIRAVCCCVRDLEFPEKEFHKDLEYYRVDVEDMSREPIELFWPEAVEFIHMWISREQPVLVHCRAGVSRSASVVIAYLIEYGGYSLHDAFFLARSHRPIVTPNIGFMEKLGEFEADKRGTEPTIDINKYTSWYTAADRAAVPDLKPD